MVEELRFGVYSSGLYCRVEGLRFRVWGLRFRIQGSGCFGLRVQGGFDLVCEDLLGRVMFASFALICLFIAEL